MAFVGAGARDMVQGHIWTQEDQLGQTAQIVTIQSYALYMDTWGWSHQQRVIEGLGGKDSNSHDVI